MKACDVMERNVTTCSPDDNLESVAMMMWNNDCGSVTMINEMGAPMGIITDRDITMSCALNHKSLWDLCVSDVTNNQSLYMCNENDNVKSMLVTMQQHKIRRLPVVNKAGHLEGIISIDDIVACSKEKAPDLSFRDTMKTLKAVCIHH